MGWWVKINMRAFLIPKVRNSLRLKFYRNTSGNKYAEFITYWTGSESNIVKSINIRSKKQKIYFFYVSNQAK